MNSLRSLRYSIYVALLVACFALPAYSARVAKKASVKSAESISTFRDELALTGNVRLSRNMPVSFTTTPSLPMLTDGIANDTGLTTDTTVSFAFSQKVIVSRVRVVFYNDRDFAWNGVKEFSVNLVSGGTTLASSPVVPTNFVYDAEVVDTRGTIMRGLEAQYKFINLIAADTVQVVINKMPNARQSTIREIEIWGVPQSMVSNQQVQRMSFALAENTYSSFVATWSATPVGANYVRVRYRVVGSSDWSSQSFSPSALKALVLGLEPGKSYEVQLDAVGASGTGNSLTRTVALPGVLEVRKVTDMLGMNFYPHQGDHPSDTQNTFAMLNLIRDANIKHVRWWFGSPGTARYFAEWGISILPMGARPDYQDLKDSGIYICEINGEPDYNNVTARKLAADYKPKHAALKQFSTTMLYDLASVGGELMGPGSDYIAELYDCLGKDGFDMVDCHPYPKITGLQPVGGTVPCPESVLGGIAAVKAVMAKYNDSAKPLIATEVGHTTKPGNGYIGQSTPDVQAKWLVRDNLLLIQSGVKRAFCYAFQDAGTDENDSEAGFGMVNWDGTPKPAYNAYKYMSTILGSTVVDGALTMMPPSYGRRFRKPSGSYITALWTCAGTNDIYLDNTASKVTAITDLFGNAISIPTQGSALNLSESVVYVFSDAKLKIAKQTKDAAAFAPVVRMKLNSAIVKAMPGGQAVINATVWHSYPTNREVQVRVRSPFDNTIIKSQVFTVPPMIPVGQKPASGSTAKPAPAAILDKAVRQEISIIVPIPAWAGVKLWSWDAQCDFRAPGATTWEGPLYRSMFFDIGE